MIFLLTEQAQVQQGQNPALSISLLTLTGKSVLVEGAFGRFLAQQLLVIEHRHLLIGDHLQANIDYLVDIG